MYHSTKYQVSASSTLRELLKVSIRIRDPPLPSRTHTLISVDKKVRLQHEPIFVLPWSAAVQEQRAESRYFSYLAAQSIYVSIVVHLQHIHELKRNVSL